MVTVYYLRQGCKNISGKHLIFNVVEVYLNEVGRLWLSMAIGDTNSNFNSHLALRWMPVKL
jgi:hypothetical protein